MIYHVKEGNKTVRFCEWYKFFCVGTINKLLICYSYEARLGSLNSFNTCCKTIFKKVHKNMTLEKLNCYILLLNIQMHLFTCLNISFLPDKSTTIHVTYNS